MKAVNWQHDELAQDLAASLTCPGRMIWTDIQLGPSGSPRPDVYTIDKSFAHPNPTAYECKISVSDFRSDVTTGKWSSYRPYSWRVIFALPAGVVSKSDIPEQCGLIQRHDNAWRLAKKPVVNPRPIAEEALLKLLIDGVEREGPKVRAKFWNERDYIRKFSDKFGAIAAKYVKDAAEVESDLARAKEQHQQIIEAAHKKADYIIQHTMLSAPVQWKALTHVLELPETASELVVREAIQELNSKQNGGAAELRRVIGQLQKIVNMAGSSLVNQTEGRKTQ
jgi:hypothetical protein